ncbi:MAG: aldehyde dehydrogenase family protein, partial [Actinomycetota bacterium]|nr:aldehyde dehydrogenase family protein [Actinomycetota bacterium]
MTSSTGLRTLQNVINGERTDAADGRTSDVIDPTTGQPYAQAPVSGQADVDAAMTAAAAAFEKWRDTTPSDRQKALLKIADAIEARVDEIVKVESENTGKPIGLTTSEELPPAIDQI